MLTDKDYERLIQPILKIYTKVETELIMLIASKFDAYDKIGGSLEWWFTKLEQSGQLNQETIKLIAKLTEASEREIYNALEQASMSVDMKSMTEAFKQGIILVDPRNVSLQHIIDNQFETIKKDIMLINSKAVENSHKQFSEVLNQAHLEVSSGTFDYNTSIKKGVEKLAKDGIIAATYLRQGVEVKQGLESVIRRTIMTGISTVANESNKHMVNEIGATHVLTSQHLGARSKGDGYENHSLWQGKVFQLVGSGEYPNFKESTGYEKGDMLGLAGYGCRHIYGIFFPGITPIPKLIDEEENDRIYTLEQKQRRYEQQIKQAKREKAALETLDELDHDAIEKKRLLIRTRQARLKKFVDSHEELRRSPAREQIYYEGVNQI